jgi:integrase
MEEAERTLARVMEQLRQIQIYGMRPDRSFEQAAAKYVLEHQHKRSLRDDISRLKSLMPWIGRVPLNKLHMGVLVPWIDDRRRTQTAVGTINQGLQIVRRILNLAASEWMDDQGLTWILAPPKIKLLPDRHKRQPYPLNWDEQERLFHALPEHLRDMAVFAVNTGCRDFEVCNLRWEWEIDVPTLRTSVFIVPGSRVKNGADRLVVLNALATSVIGRRRDQHGTHVFAYRGAPIDRMLNSAWKRARNCAGLSQVRVHDLKHTFGRRLRAAGVSFEDRQDLLGHHSSRVTTHYSAAELVRLIEAANRVCGSGREHPEIVVLRGTVRTGPAKLPQSIPLVGRLRC